MQAYGYNSEAMRRTRCATNNPRERAGCRTTLVPLPRAERTLPRKRIGVHQGALIAVLLVLACALSFGWLARLPLMDASLTPDVARASNDAKMGVNDVLATSTPVAQWKRGEMPYLYQTDPVWADVPYAGATVRTHGCGPTCLSMVQAFFMGQRAKDPRAMAALSEQEGFVDGGATSWTFMTEGAAKAGLSGRELPASADVVRAQLRMGHPVICCVEPGDFTTVGHFIVLVDEEADGTISIRDPNSAEHSRMTWDLDRILGQCRNIWAFSA